MISKPTGMSPDGETISMGVPNGTVGNLFDTDAITKGYYVVYNTTEKYFPGYTLGSCVKNSQYSLSDYIPVTAGNKFLILWYSGSSDYRNSITWYDSNKQYIGYTAKSYDESIGGQMVTAPNKGTEINSGESIGDNCTVFSADAAYMRLCFNSGYMKNEVWGGYSYTNNLTFTVQLQTGSAVEMIDESAGTCYATLILWTGDKYYNFHFGKNNNQKYAPIVTEGINGITVKLSIPLDNESMSGLSGKYYSISSAKQITSSYKTLLNLLHNGKTISWKLRLYEKGSIQNDGAALYIPNEKINYGTISAVDKVYDVSSYIANNKTYNGTTYTSQTKQGYRLTVFPYQNIYDDVVDLHGRDSVSDKNSLQLHNQSNVCDTVYNIYKNIDENIHYWIIADGYQIPISMYRLYPYTYTIAGDYKESNRTEMAEEPAPSLDFSEDFDGYGNPIHGYAVCLKADYGGTDITDEILEGLADETYEIRTNYIDSQWSYFDIYDDAEIKITDNIGRELFEGEVYSNTFSELKLNIFFVQKQGIGLNYYSFKVYSYDERNEEWNRDYYSTNYYNQIPVITYNNFFSGKRYKILITMTDVNQRTYEKTLYFSTDFPAADYNLVVDASYYSPHHSIIVDWSNINSINPSIGVNSSDCKYYAITDRDNGYTYEESSGMNTDYDISIQEHHQKTSLYVPTGSSLTYRENDFHTSLNFERSAFIIDFYGTNLSGISNANSELFTFSTSDGFNVSVRYYDNERIFVYTSNYSYAYHLYNPNYTTADIAAQLSDTNESARPYSAPFVWDNALMWDDSYTWREDNNIIGKWRLIITPDKCVLIPLSSYNSVYKSYSYIGRNSKKYESELTLYGEVIYDAVTVINDADTDMIFKTYAVSPYPELQRDSNTQFLCDFNGHINGANNAVALKNLVGYRVYKTLGDSNKLYEIANVDADASCILEDFAVGDNCKYTYYIYPVIKTAIKYGEQTYEVETISTPMKTDPIIFDNGIDKVFGLKEIGDRVYEAVPDEIWRLHLNLEDNGYTLNTDKNFYDTFNQYNQETVGNRKYITKSISGLIGYIDCASGGEYTDNYDILTSWNDFTASANMKCLIDSRGLILPGNFEANPTVEYMQTHGSPATAKFNWRQKSDLNIIKIYATLLPFNPTRGTYLTSSEKFYLNADEATVLYTTK